MNDKKLKVEGGVYFTLFIGVIFLANYMVRNIGAFCTPDNVCLIPVWPGIMAPSGVLAIGLGFTLRDLVQRRLGVKFTIIGILIGAAVSALLSPALAFASGSAFLLSELFDLFVYTPLQRRHLFVAVLGSNIVGLIVDSVVFLWLAFGSLQFIEGQIIGKVWMTLIAFPFIWLLRQHDQKRGIQPVTS